MAPMETLTDYGDDCYLAYPHTNGFAQDGRLVVGQMRGDTVRLLTIDPETRQSSVIAEFGPDQRGEHEPFLWFDVSLGSSELAVAVGNNISLAELSGGRTGALREIAYHEGLPSGGRLPSISADGDTVLCETRAGGRFGLVRVHTRTGDIQSVVSHSWHANHFHFCPHDEAWIGYAHEGTTTEIPDRVWTWNGDNAPQGECLFDQTASGLCLGHERWCFHHTSCLVVAYGDSPQGPRGIYEISPGHSPKLVSESDRDWHVNVSRDGRLAVVDTIGAHDQPGRGWEGVGSVSDIVLIDVATGRRKALARTRMGRSHPWHPHPTFCPRGEWVYYNESDPSGLGGRICRVRVEVDAFDV